MEKFAAFFCLISIFSMANAAPQEANEKIYVSLASCNSILEGMQVRLDFLQEVSSDFSGTPTGEGFFVQTSGGENGLKHMGKLKVVSKENSNKTYSQLN